MTSIYSISEKISQEWEKVLLALMALFFLFFLVVSGLWIAKWWTRPKYIAPRPKKILSLFSAQAFSFIQPEKRPVLPADHAFLTKPPPGWKPPPRAHLPVRAPIAPPRRIQVADLLAQFKASIAATKKGVKLDRPVTPPAPGRQPPVAGTSRLPKPAAPKPDKSQNLLQYQGFIVSPSGKKMALLTCIQKNRDGEVSLRRSLYLERGQGVPHTTLRVNSFDAAQVVFLPAKGKAITLKYGKQMDVKP